MKVLLIIPAYNEEKNIQRVIENLKVNLPDCDYVIVNDCSTDQTGDMCEKNHYNYIDLSINLGLAGAVQAGYKYAYENDYDVAIQYDGDGQHKAEYIPILVDAIKQGANIVIGSRFVNKPKPFNLRMIGSRLISLCIKLTTGVTVQDPTSGMRAIDKKLIKEFAFEMNYPPEPDTIAYQLRKGAVIEEIQVEMDERTEGESYLGIINSVKYMMRMLTSILLIQGFRK
ncbi:MAG: glycosyltransferase family 2 protein [Turicibacter sp.]|nr:glycosyltransferase family 2 protein [Turicibacter sp.]